MHRFRSIHIFEADLNLVMEVLIARNLMQHAEKKGLPESQWGGRKFISSTDLGLAKQLIIQHAKLTGTPTALIELDATACYDRIVRSVGILAMASMGLHEKAARWILTLLEKMQFQNNINNTLS